MSKLLTTTALCMALGLGLAQAQQQTPTTPQAETPSVSPPTPSPTMSADRFMTEQTTNEMSAEDMIGAVVYDATNNRIGEINDLIMDKNGSVQAAVIGVGGFLGIGEKDVAVKFSELQPRMEDNGDIRVTLSATKEQLQNAPEFAYLREQRRTTDQPATGAVRRDGAPTTPQAPRQ